MKPAPLSALDKAIAAVAPAWAVSRARARSTLAVMQHYDAAGGGKRTAGYRAPPGDGNAAARSNVRLRSVARDMVRNNAIASTAVSRLVNYVIGDGIIPKIEADGDAGERLINEALLQHVDTTSVDALGRLNLYGLQRLAFETMVVAGEALVRRRPRRLNDSVARLPVQMEVLDPEFLDSRQVRLTQDRAAPLEVDGIEFDLRRRRVAYRLFEAHPEDYQTGFPTSSLVTARNVAHLYRVDRPGQRRGISWLAPAITWLDDTMAYADAQLVRQKIAAMWVGFTTDTTSEPDGDDPKDVTLRPGMMEHLPPGRDFQFAQPPRVEGYSEHMQTLMRLIAASLDLTYEDLTGDLSQVNFSSARMGRLPVKAATEAAQHQVVMPALIAPMQAWLQDALDALPRTDLPTSYAWKWTAPRMPMTDPGREVNAAIAEIQAGLSSRVRKVRELGWDPEEIDREIAQDEATQTALGVRFRGSPMAAQVSATDDGGETDGE